MKIIEPTILTNMCMVTDGKGNVLVQERNDPWWPGITFPGGHVEKQEPFADSVIREVWEETGITIESPALCGIKHFYTDENNLYIVLLYKADKFSGEIKVSSEGSAYWMPLEDIFTAKTVPDFGSILKVYLSPEVCELYYTPENMGGETIFR